MENQTLTNTPFGRQFSGLTYGLICLLFFAILALLSLSFAPRSPVDATAKVAPPAPEVKRVPKVELKPAKVKAYAPKAKQELALPEPAASNPSIYALGATRIEPDFHPVTVTTTLDEATGEVAVYEKREPLPWAALTRRGEAGIAYGMKSDGTMGGRLFVNQALLDVKALRLGLAATLDQDGMAFGGVSLSFRW